MFIFCAVIACTGKLIFGHLRNQHGPKGGTDEEVQTLIRHTCKMCEVLIIYILPHITDLIFHSHHSGLSHYYGFRGIKGRGSRVWKVSKDGRNVKKSVSCYWSTWVL